MNLKQFLLATLVAIATFSFTYKVEYKVDNQKSKLNWVGRKVTGEHSGSINLADGVLVTDGKKVTGGTFTIDMTSITNEDLKDEGYNQKLIGHLKSEDFFATEKFPKAQLVINKVTPLTKDQYKIKGALTIKGITNEVEFPASISTTKSEIKAKAKIIVDRTKFDIKYGSGSFFDNLGDKAISNDFEMNVELVAKANDGGKATSQLK
jgi:polyisoprenoid-binding protein YceI